MHRVGFFFDFLEKSSTTNKLFCHSALGVSRAELHGSSAPVTGELRPCVGDVESSESAVCTYISYFDQIDRDGLGPTDSILRTHFSALIII